MYRESMDWRQLHMEEFAKRLHAEFAQPDGAEHFKRFEEKHSHILQILSRKRPTPRWSCLVGCEYSRTVPGLDSPQTPVRIRNIGNINGQANIPIWAPVN